MPGNSITCEPLDMNDTQGDKAVVSYLQSLGATIKRDDSAMRISVESGGLIGRDIDLNATPDAVPMMAALGCFCDGNLRLSNVKHARIKETDRIAVMAMELAKFGVDVKTFDDGLEVRGRGGEPLNGAVEIGRASCRERV